MDEVERLKLAASTLGIEWTSAIAEKADELEQRNFLRLVPAASLNSNDIPDFLRRVLGSEPSPELIDRVTLSARRYRPTTAERIAMEKSQNFRCAVCGAVLNRDSNKQVDHILPIALGGTDTIANMQLLCMNCNSGKSMLVSWVLGRPFIEFRRTSRLEYCVLSRFDSTCQSPGCGVTSRDDTLKVMPIVSPVYGGRWVFDNLTVYCRQHLEHRENQLLNKVANLTSRRGSISRSKTTSGIRIIARSR